MIDMTRKHGLVIIENPLIPFKGYKLINLCGLIFCRRGVADAITETDANHERIHTEQQKEMLVVFFYLWYLFEWVVLWINYYGDSRKAYRQVGFEEKAYMGERNPNYINSRKHIAWVKFIF